MLLVAAYWRTNLTLRRLAPPFRVSKSAADPVIAEQSKNYRCSINHQAVIDAGIRLAAAVGRSLPGNRNGCKAWELSGAKDAIGHTTVSATRTPGRPASS